MTIPLSADFPEEVRSLGEPIAEFKIGGGTFLFFMTVGILGLLLGLAMLGWPLLELVEIAEKGKGVIHVGRAIFGGLMLMSGGVVALVKAFKSRGLKVFAFASGLAQIQKISVEIMRWDEVEEVLRTHNEQSQGLTLRSPVQLTLKAKDGRTWIFDERMSHLRELRMLVEGRTLKHLLQSAREAYDAGKTVVFGVVDIKQDGVAVGNTVFPWDIVEEATAERGRLTFAGRDQGKPLGYVDLAQVPNAHVLVALVEHARSR